MNAASRSSQAPYFPDAVVVVNGATQSSPTGGRSEGGGDPSTCTNGGNCPLGFCYFGTLHGPFWQSTPSSIPISDFAYRGKLDQDLWRGRPVEYSFLSDLGGPPTPPPGGTVFCTPYDEKSRFLIPPNALPAPFLSLIPTARCFLQKVDATVTASTVVMCCRVLSATLLSQTLKSTNCGLPRVAEG